MAGIYIHIPFCRQACHYCDFHFSTSLKYKEEMLQAITREITLQKQFLANEEIETIYFGGGTPSLLSADEINKITDHLNANFNISQNAEITLEANPDDLNSQKINSLKNTLVNRFSIGLQSYFDEDLKWMNRAHSAKESEFAIKASQDAGFENITVDLIYGYPLLSNVKWLANINRTVGMDIKHISCYSMTVEPLTALASFINKGKQKPMDESQSAEQFQLLMQEMDTHNLEHYEISNFAKAGYYSKHNTNYWKGVKYLGLGPSAHSFNGINRQWNIANNAAYLSALSENKIPAETEFLTEENKLNEYIMTSLRTMWGLDLIKIAQDYGEDASAKIKEFAGSFIEKGWINLQQEKITLTKEGKLYADHIASELFTVQDEF